MMGFFMFFTANNLENKKGKPCIFKNSRLSYRLSQMALFLRVFCERKGASGGEKGQGNKNFERGAIERKVQKMDCRRKISIYLLYTKLDSRIRRAATQYGFRSSHRPSES